MSNNTECAVLEKHWVTRFEMELLCRYWVGEMRRIEESWKDEGVAQSNRYAAGRLGYFGQFLGDQKLHETLGEERSFSGEEA